MTSTARYQWTHGVPPIGKGTRKSLSWRYLQDNATTDSGHPDTEPQLGRLPSLERPTKRSKKHKEPCPTATKLIILSLCDGIGAVPWAAENLWPG